MKPVYVVYSCMMGSGLLILGWPFFCDYTIPPQYITDSAITESMVRFQMYVTQHRTYPPDLSVLPTRERYANRIVDGWGRPLIYKIDPDGAVSFQSLGRDGKPGGEGLDQDVIERRRTKNPDGTLNVDDELWIVRSEIHAP